MDEHMPINIDEFEARDPAGQTTNAERVLRFLAQNPEQAYRAVEIANATGVNHNSIHPVLNRLESRRLVRHREPYWAVGELEAVHDAFVFQSSAAFLDDEVGPESREKWMTAAEKCDSGTEE